LSSTSARFRRAFTILALGLVAAVLAGCEPAGRVRDANLVVIGIDTLRADHLGCYGYPRPTSPRLDALSREGVLFTTAISPSPWTLPAFASMFTGLLPSSHRAGEGWWFERTRLDPSFVTLAEVLRGTGYRTGSFVSNGFVSPDTGVADGFEETRVWFSGKGATPAAIAWLDTHAAERFFLFLHIVEPHHPYSPPEEHAAPFLDRSYEGLIGTSFGEAPDPDWTDADRQRIIDLYDGEVSFADALVGDVLDKLAQLGVDDDTIVVVTADHGEELFERGTIGHGHSLYDELLRVPLIIRWPGREPHGRVEQQVRTMDLFPTLLDALGLPVPPGLDGVSLLPLARGEPQEPGSATALAEYLFGDREQKAIRRQDHKLILTLATNEGSLFDLRADAGERRDVAEQHASLVREFRAELERTLLVLLEGFRLLARGGRTPHLLAAQFRTTSGIIDLGFQDFEGRDRHTITPDGRVLEVYFHFGDDDALPEGSIDDDGVRFRTIDGAPVELKVRLDGAAIAPERLDLGATTDHLIGPQPWRLEIADPRLIVPIGRPPRTPVDDRLEAFLLYVQRPPPSFAAMDEETRENLRALGYVN
jgi:arylsulfatase A-like enzyme